MGDPFNPPSSLQTLQMCPQNAYYGDKELFMSESRHLDEIGFTTRPCLSDKLHDPQEAVKIAKKGDTFIQQGNISKASQCYLKAIQMDQKRAEYWFKYASLLFDLGKLKEAYRFLSNIDRTNRTPDVLKLGGRILSSLGFFVAAEHWLRTATKLNQVDDEETLLIFQQTRTKRHYEPLTSNLPVEVRFTTEMIRGIYAKDFISEDQVLLRDFAAIHIQTIETAIECFACFNCGIDASTPETVFKDKWNEMPDNLREIVSSHWPHETSVNCDKCGFEVYCSAQCRQAAWEDYHRVLCSSFNPDAELLHRRFLEDKAAYLKTKEEEEEEGQQSRWNAKPIPSYLLLAKMWAKIISKVEKLWKEEGTEGPTDAHWEKARDPFRRFIGFGKEGYSNKAGVKPCFEDLRIIFRNENLPVPYDIDGREYDGRHYQLANNAQFYGPPKTNYQIFVETLTDEFPYEGILDDIKLYLDEEPRRPMFGGLFPLHACLNHSCYHNCEVKSDFIRRLPGVQVYNVRPISKDDQCFISYIDPHQPKRERQTQLLSSYAFICKCLLCTFEGTSDQECLHCDKKVTGEGKKFPFCSRCKRAWYCSAQCQKDNWKAGHSIVCAELRK